MSHIFKIAIKKRNKRKTKLHFKVKWKIVVVVFFIILFKSTYLWVLMQFHSIRNTNAKVASKLLLILMHFFNKVICHFKGHLSGIKTSKEMKIQGQQMAFNETQLNKTIWL